MNVASLFVGDILGEIGTKTASHLIQSVLKNNSNFSSIFNNLQNSSSAVQVEDLDLSKNEMLELNKIRELAMERGLENMEIMIEGSKFNFDIKDNTLTAVIG